MTVWVTCSCDALSLPWRRVFTSLLWNTMPWLFKFKQWSFLQKSYDCYWHLWWSQWLWNETGCCHHLQSKMNKKSIFFCISAACLGKLHLLHWADDGCFICFTEQMKAASSAWSAASQPSKMSGGHERMTLLSGNKIRHVDKNIVNCCSQLQSGSTSKLWRSAWKRPKSSLSKDCPSVKAPHIKPNFPKDVRWTISKKKQSGGQAIPKIPRGERKK